MDEKELKEIFEALEQQGWEPMLCDTPVPLYDNEVACGVPNGVGDVMKETIMIPREFLSMQSEFYVKAKGDSMKGADILNGDLLQVVTTGDVSDGDIVLAYLDDDFTVKTYCEDEEGHPWLVPQNDAYEPFRLEDYDHVWIAGVVNQVTRRAPRVNYRTCMKIINKARKQQPKGISPEQVARAIREVAPMVEVGRRWYAVCRVLEDEGVLSDGDFEGFCQLVRAEVPEHKSLPTRVEMQRLAVQSFKKPVAMWNELNAPVQGKRYKDYVKIAQQMQDLLGKA
ncbi:MAG: hypothetical protein J6T38_09930 [Bacteroidaceae bacterium]|nr:hypothetical protein [Bacteroidaceae bacterium]